MSIPAKAVLFSSCIFTAGIISYVHYKQYLDREQLHQGVIRDMERRQKRKQENIYVLQQQIDLTKEINKRLEEEGRINASIT